MRVSFIALALHPRAGILDDVFAVCGIRVFKRLANHFRWVSVERQAPDSIGELLIGQIVLFNGFAKGNVEIFHISVAVEWKALPIRHHHAAARKLVAIMLRDLLLAGEIQPPAE